MILSVGHLHSAHRLIDIALATAMSPQQLLAGLRTVLVCPAEPVLNLSMRCGWLRVDADGCLRPTERGIIMHGATDFRIRMREQMRDIIVVTTPAWAKLIPRGRAELSHYVPADIEQCFVEAGLLDANPSREIVQWWDELASQARGLRSNALLDIGREGERRSLAYEHERTGTPPLWQAIESNLSGFDILSVVAPSNSAPLKIEVKASEMVDEATVYISSNTWETATTSRYYVFHLWRLKPAPALAVLTVGDMKTHIPNNAGQGCWETVAIPFASFSERFDQPRC